MAIATQKIKEMLDAQRDEALGLYKAFVDKWITLRSADPTVDEDIDALKVSVDLVLSSLETLKTVLAMDNGPQPAENNPAFISISRPKIEPIPQNAVHRVTENGTILTAPAE